MIRCQAITKNYAEFAALRGVTFEVEPGRLSLWFLPGAFAVCLGSLFLYGFLWDRYERI